MFDIYKSKFPEVENNCEYVSDYTYIQLERWNEKDIKEIIDKSEVDVIIT